MIPPRRRFGPVAQMVSDVIRFSVATRSWAMLAILAVGIGALVVGLVAQVVAPWAIYPFV